jgi:hypothetical protein
MRTSRFSFPGCSLASLTGALAAATALILIFGGTARAALNDDAFGRLLALNPGLSAAELEESMHEAAAVTGDL